MAVTLVFTQMMESMVSETEAKAMLPSNMKWEDFDCFRGAETTDIVCFLFEAVQRFVLCCVATVNA